MVVGLVGLLAVALLATDAPAAPRCEGVARIEPAQAFVGQQIAYGLRILRHETTGSVRWERNLEFPGFRVEWLPGSIQPGVRDALGPADVFEERRALFPARVGRLPVPAAGILCNGPDGDLLAEVAPIEVLSMPLPDVGQPEDFGGIVGRVGMSANLDRETVGLGGSVRLSVLVHGPANLWEVRLDPTPELAEQEAEVFAHPVEIARDVGRRLTLRRYAVFDVVPRKTGSLVVPALSVPYFDPETARYERARTRPLEIFVEARAAAAPEERPTEEAPAEAADAPVPLWLLGVAGVVAATVLGARLRQRSGAGADPREEIAACMARAEQASAEGRPADALEELARSARLALSRRVPGALGLSTEELFERAGSGPGREWVQLLQRLDRMRFSGTPDPAETRDVMASLARSLRHDDAAG
ncbi:MAG: hypothetical protein QNK05_06115 [Myxococcota bacterium]|nr:hypothetical protein [Myxococcota bacterium]